MLDHLSISHQSGTILWTRSYVPAFEKLASGPSNPLNELVKEILIEGRVGASHVRKSVVKEDEDTESWEKDGRRWRWCRDNENGLIFAAAHHPLLPLPYLPLLLKTLRELFIAKYQPFLLSIPSLSSSLQWDLSAQFEGWDKTVDKVVTKAEESQRSKSSGKKWVPVKKEIQEGSAPSTPTRTLQETESPAVSPAQDAEEISKNVQALKARLKAGGGKRAPLSRTGSPAPSSPGGSEAEGSPVKSSKKGGAASKVMRKWGDQPVSSSEMESFDFSTPPPPSLEGETSTPTKLSAQQKADIFDESAMGSKGKDGIYSVADLAVEDDSDDEDKMIEKALERAQISTSTSTKSSSTGATAVATGMMSSFFSRLTGSKPLTKEELTSILEAMEKHLMEKNVAREIAATLCQGVENRLLGKKLGSFGSVKAEVKKSLSESITRILTPKTSTDILLSIKRKQQSSTSVTTPDPFKMVFIGVNGVGKSTNLSKVCFWLLQNDMKVLIAACDTFRSGAVEQLKVHVKNLGLLNKEIGDVSDSQKIELFERGYGKDAAGIAKEAIAYAKDNKFDVVLIDTAGRMQDNEPLMRSLSKLVTVNTPDKIVFVGEALVGNEAVDQLKKFDLSLREGTKSSGGKERGIDGIILTKFDTIDDKVGAALSMTYVTGQPILFVGCGQTYTDLRHLKVENIVTALLRD